MLPLTIIASVFASVFCYLIAVEITAGAKWRRGRRQQIEDEARREKNESRWEEIWNRESRN